MTSFLTGVLLAAVLAAGTLFVYSHYPISMIERTDNLSVTVDEQMAFRE